MIVANADTFTDDKVLTAKDRMEALLMSSANEDRAAILGPDEQPMKDLLMRNAALFLRFAS
jgi:hypothetical protein